ncbi:MAG: MarR family winged helix-turn-helix transcriptional regulator [Geminicoccaceae bacterium]
MARVERIEDCISFVVAKAAQRVTRRARELLAPCHLTPTQYAVLKVLWERDGQNASDLAARLQIDSATITGVIDRLEASGLVERRSLSDDRRVNPLYTTRQARSLRERADAAMDQLNAEIRDALGSRAPVAWKALDAIARQTRGA